MPVPLDRSGLVPGVVSLHVERVLPPTNPPRGVMLLLAGGPGQPGSATFNLAESAPSLRLYFPGYTLATFDIRGTGKSGPLSCPSLQTLLTIDVDVEKAPGLVGACGSMIGDSRRFYSTRDHAEDTELVRQALGVDKIGLWGTSYGTRHAMVYALAHPDHVERLVLDSVVPPEGEDAFGSETLRAIPGALSNFCGRTGCSAATPNAAADVVALANRLAAKPISGKVLVPGGSHLEKLDGVQFLSLVVQADLDPGLAAELPAAVRAALQGRPLALLRLARIESQSITPTEDLNAALFAATVCDDGPLPWTPETPIAQRQALIDAAIAALPAGTLGPFGPWATKIGSADMCKLWPEQPAPVDTPLQAPPNVPVLVLNGERDTRTPVASAASVAARFPQGHLLVVPNVGHSVLGADLSGCAVRALRLWMAGQQPPTTCERSPWIVSPLAAFPATASGVAPLGLGGREGRTLGAVVRTAREAAASWGMSVFSLGGESGTVAGLYGGRLTPTGAAFRLVRYSIIPGVELTGTLSLDRSGDVVPIRFLGPVTVSGSKAVAGKLVIGQSRVRGTLAKRKIDVALR